MSSSEYYIIVNGLQLSFWIALLFISVCYELHFYPIVQQLHTALPELLVFSIQTFEG